MSNSERPWLRALEIERVDSDGRDLWMLRDPEGYGRTLMLSHAAASLALLLDGRRTLADVARAFFDATGVTADPRDVAAVVEKLDEACLLGGARFEERRREVLTAFARSRTRPARHAGSSYPSERQRLADYLAEGLANLPPLKNPAGRLAGILSPHIDLGRGLAGYAAAYQHVARQPARVFVIFGTAHDPMPSLASVCRKDFATPLGTVRTERKLVDRFLRQLDGSLAGRNLDVVADDPVHRTEHSIEFQAVWLKHVLGQTPFSIVPILVGSLHEYLEEGLEPADTPEFQALLEALRHIEARADGPVCYISAADLAHIGPRFGDEATVDRPRLAQLELDDKRLLAEACRVAPDSLFRQIAQASDRNRICGLAPTYLFLHAIGAAQGELLDYRQAVEDDGSGCVSFAAAAFYTKPNHPGT